MQKLRVMSTAHWHLLLNHLPIIGTVIGTLILISGFFLKNNLTIKQTALGVLIFTALTSIPAYLTGEGAEELVEELPGVSENLIGVHEDLGKIFLIALIILGALSMITLLASLYKNKIASVLYVVVLVGSLGTCVLAQQIGTSGGEVRHTEIRNDYAGQNGNTSVQKNKAEIDDDHD